MKKDKGVYKATKKDGTCYFRASITFHGKHISLGSFTDSSLANAAYLEAGTILSDRTLLPDSYLPAFLGFDKAVVLMNFRDHNIYIKTPIYIRNRFFTYYYDRDTTFLFDIDDLFYYAGHKIMKRGRHLFVADYGMQINILNRYGIRNFAVEGRDYYFANGSSNDFRYANVICINPYHGVLRIKDPGKACRYRVKIHVRGDYLVGTYDTVIEAAIAYNKAADTLKQQGFNRNYEYNYIDGISSSAYSDIYAACRISPKLSQMTISPSLI